MAYFAAALTRSSGARDPELAEIDGDWAAREFDLDQPADLAALADALRVLAADDGPVLLLLEREDEWFAVVRVDGDDDPRVFVSDAGAASESPYAELLGVEALDEELANEPVGDFDVLADLGTTPAQLRGLSDGELAATPAEALAVIGEAAGFDDVLESIR